MLTPLELQMVMSQQEIGSYCNCASIAEPEPVELEGDSVELVEVKDSLIIDKDTAIFK